MSPNLSSEPVGGDLRTEIALFRYGLIAPEIHGRGQVLRRS